MNEECTPFLINYDMMENNIKCNDCVTNLYQDIIDKWIT